MGAQFLRVERFTRSCIPDAPPDSIRAVVLEKSKRQGFGKQALKLVPYDRVMWVGEVKLENRRCLQRLVRKLFPQLPRWPRGA